MEKLLCLIPLLLLFGAFSKATRVAMFKRDKATCQECGRKWNDGWMLHAAHYNHDHSRADYDSVEAGRMLCIDCHQADHQRRLDRGEDVNANAYAVRKLKKTDRRRYGY